MTAKCHDCDRPYSDPGFQDLIILNHHWRKISPTGDEGGSLCPSCMCGRLEKAGIKCAGSFMSGPIESVSSHLMQVLREMENIQEGHFEDRRGDDRSPEKHGPIYLSQKEFDDLLEYSASYPTGVIIGKCWKAHLRTGEWVHRTYLEHPTGDESKVIIRERDIMIAAHPPM